MAELGKTRFHAGGSIDVVVVDVVVVVATGCGRGYRDDGLRNLHGGSRSREQEYDREKNQGQPLDHTWKRECLIF